jgi:hypothetical protein
VETSRIVGSQLTPSLEISFMKTVVSSVFQLPSPFFEIVTSVPPKLQMRRQAGWHRRLSAQEQRSALTLGEQTEPKVPHSPQISWSRPSRYASPNSVRDHISDESLFDSTTSTDLGAVQCARVVSQELGDLVILLQHAYCTGMSQTTNHCLHGRVFRPKVGAARLQFTTCPVCH